MEFFGRVETAGEAVARQVAETRTRQGLSKQGLADRLGMDRATVHRLEAGARNVTVSELVELAAALNVSPISLAVPRGEFDGLLVDGVPIFSADARGWWRGWSIPDPVPFVYEDGTEVEASPGLDVDERRFYSETADDEWRAYRQPYVRELMDAVLSVISQAGNTDETTRSPELVAWQLRNVAKIAEHHAERLEQEAE